jgi:2-desacetyl-2-hydroxyethyl bacteriochlorophyllide A dehydrogenase
VEVRTGHLPEPGPGQVLVHTLISAISPGTELLIYRGQFPIDLPVDESLPALSGDFHYPLRYGYSAVGRVAALGSEVDAAWENRNVFAFQPHSSYFLASPNELLTLQEGLLAEDAVFLPNMETAVNFVMDGNPRIGESAAVFGQGIVGLLTTALLARFPLADLLTLDHYPLRRRASLELGANASLDPAGPQTPKQMLALLPDGADLTFELTGSPEALDQAIASTGFAGRVVIGSWYGQKRASLDLGGRFHRSRIHLISSQVSSISPELTGRWDKARRFALAWDMLRQVRPSRWITHRFSLAQASQAYRLLDQDPREAIQIVFRYEDV